MPKVNWRAFTIFTMSEHDLPKACLQCYLHMDFFRHDNSLFVNLLVIFKTEKVSSGKETFLNRLLGLAGRFANLRTLGTLRLCGNNISRPPKEALGALQSLQNLYLNRNNLTQLSKNAFGNIPVLSKLELSGNKIFNISYAAFENVRQMTSVDLSFNNLSWVPPGAFLGKFHGQ